MWLFGVFGILPVLFGHGLTTKRRWGLAERIVSRTGMHWAWEGAVLSCLLELAFIGIEIPIIGVFGVTTSWAVIQVIMTGVLLLPSTKRFYRIG